MEKASPLPPHLSILRSFQFRARVLRCYCTLGWREKSAGVAASLPIPPPPIPLRWIEIEALIGRGAQEPSSPPPPSPYQYKDVTGLANPPLFPFPRHASAAAADKVFSSSASQPRSGAGGKKVGGGDDDDAPKIRRGGRKSSPPSPSSFFLTSFRNGKTIRCTSPWAARKRGIPSSDGEAWRGIRSGAPQRKSGNRGATEALLSSSSRERTVAQPPSKGVESGGAVATHVDPLCMRGTNGGLTAEKSPCFLDGNSGRETKKAEGASYKTESTER